MKEIIVTVILTGGAWLLIIAMKACHEYSEASKILKNAYRRLWRNNEIT